MALPRNEASFSETESETESEHSSYDSDDSYDDPITPRSEDSYLTDSGESENEYDQLVRPALNNDLFTLHHLLVYTEIFAERVKLDNAVYANDEAGVRKALLSGAEADTHLIGTEPHLFTAARNNHAGIIKLLLQYGADPNQCFGENGLTALLAAIHENSVDAIGALLEGGANPNNSRYSFIAPLLMAVVLQRDEAVSKLINHKETLINQTFSYENSGPMTVLSIAKEIGATNIATMLIAKGAVESEQVRTATVSQIGFYSAHTKLLPVMEKEDVSIEEMANSAFGRGSNVAKKFGR